MSKECEALVEAHTRGYRIHPSGSMVASPEGNEIRGFTRSRQSLYIFFNIKINGKPRLVSFSRLQAYQKYGERVMESGIVVRHRDGNPKNNSWDNILIGTESENQMDRPAEARLAHARHAASFSRRFTEEQVEDMRNMRKQGFKLSKIGEKYNVGKGHVSVITRNMIYVNNNPRSEVGGANPPFWANIQE